MFDQFRKFMNPKNSANRKSLTRMILIYVIFGAIILVFALFGLDRSNSGDSTGGVAAVVNDAPISLAEYRTRVENVEQNARGQFDQFPEAQRRQFSAELRKRALEELILGEIVFQAADRKGVMASDPEVRDYIVQIPFLQENGRFQRERYQAFLQNTNLNTVDFERQVRKQLVTQKLQDLFVGSASPTREELKRARMLANQKVNLRFARVTSENLANPAMVSAAEAQGFLEKNQAQVEKYYNDNKVEFSKAEMLKARHILLRANEKRDEAATAKAIEDLRKQATPANFAALAKQHSEDPGSKEKGGDLGEFERGRMVPAFETAAFALPAGEISQPVKSDFGYHLIFVEGKKPAKTQPLAEVQTDIARKLLARAKETEISESLKKSVEAGDRGQVDSLLTKTGVKWDNTGEFDLTADAVPKVGESPALMGAILKQGKAGGMIRQLISTPSGYVVAEVLSWKEAPDTNPDIEGMERTVAYRKSNDLIESWSKQAEASADVQRNPRLVQTQ